MQNMTAVNTGNGSFNQTFGLWITSILTSKTPAQTTTANRINSNLTLLSMARDLEQSQPNLAAEFRNFASRS